VSPSSGEIWAGGTPLYITMLQCRLWGRGTGIAGEWEALTQGTMGEKITIVAPNLQQVSARFLLPELSG